MRSFYKFLTITGLIILPAEISAADRKCSTRLSISLLGQSPTAEFLEAEAPLTNVPAMLKTPEFIEKFARFANAQMNDRPGADAAEDSAYHIVKHVLTNDLRWAEVFSGKFDLRQDRNQAVTVTESANGLGYFRTAKWLERYAGNEDEGVRLAAIYRIMQNLIGLELKAAPTESAADVSATGRRSAACSNCHYDDWYALDKNAEILPRVIRSRNGDFRGFARQSDTPIDVLDDKTAANDQDFITLLLASEDHNYHACKLAFKFVTGRQESTCESGEMNNCLSAYKASGKIQDAIKSFTESEDICRQ